MSLLNPWWLLVPASALMLMAIILFWQMLYQRPVPFTAMHWLHPATRRKWAPIRRPPLWMLLTAGAVMVSALGTLHISVEPAKKTQTPISIQVAIRYVGGHEYGFIRTMSQSALPEISVIGPGKSVRLAPSQLLHGVVFPLSPARHPSHIGLESNGKIIWQKPIPPWALHHTLGVVLGKDIPPVVTRALRAISWVKIEGTAKPTSLFIGHRMHRRFPGSELILANRTSEVPIKPAKPIVMASQVALLKFVQFRHVLVHRLKLLRPAPGWQTLVQVNRRPWLIQRHRLGAYDWVAGSSFFDDSTNWPKFASFVIFMTNALHLANRVPPTTALWMASGVVMAESPDEKSRLEISWTLALLAAAMAVGALWNLQSHRIQPAHPAD